MENNLLKFKQENLDKKWDYENGFYLTSDVCRMGKQIAHYELYKKIVNIPGEVFEFGVYKGTSIIRFATYREFLENTYSRKIIGFDAFGKFPKADNRDDNDFIEKFESQGGYGISKLDLEQYIYNKGLTNIELIQGDILKTLDEYLEENKHIKISLLHIDVDVYKPTKFVLEKLYNRVVSGGVIILDDYARVKGATDAIDEFFDDKEESIKKMPFSYIPCYVIKK